MDQNTCFLKDVLVSKEKISYLLDFDQTAYICNENIEDKLPEKNKSVQTKVLIKFFRNREPVNLSSLSFHSDFCYVARDSI